MRSLFSLSIAVVFAIGCTPPDKPQPTPAEVARPVAPVKGATSGMPIVNVHEHIQSVAEADRLLAAMDGTGIAKTVLMGSSWFTVTLDQSVGFTRVHWNNEQIIEIAKKYPGRFLAWPTIDPSDPKKLEKLKGYVAKGASGLKLYLGHGLHDLRPGGEGYFFHPVAMDDPSMAPVYAYLQQKALPIMFHVNPGPTAPGFADEFITVVRTYPDLKIIAPHFLLSSIKSSRLRELLDAFPNVYSDVSFGHDDFLSAGLKRIGRSPKKFKKILADYPTRFMFGTDVVVTAHAEKSSEWIAVRVRAYLDMLSKDEYTTDVVPGQTLKGLALPDPLLKAVLYENFERFVALTPAGTPTGAIDWSQLGIPKTPRAPGTQLPRDAWDAWRAEQKRKREERKRKREADKKKKSTTP